MRLLLVGFLLFTTVGAQEPVRAAVPVQTPTNRFYSPAIDAGDYVYISGQGPRRPDGGSPSTFGAQVRQALDNVKAMVESTGLTMEHVVYTQVYLEDISKYAEMNKVFARIFPKDSSGASCAGRSPPSGLADSDQCRRGAQSGRAEGCPSASTISQTKRLARHSHARPAFHFQHAGRDPVSSKVPEDPAAQVDLALDRLKAVVKAAGLELSHMVFVNPYLTADIPMRVMNERYARRFEFGNTPARATIEVSSLPERAHIEYTGVAVRDLQQRQARFVPRTCHPARPRVPVFLLGTLYIVRRRVASFPGRTAASTPPPPRINSARPCAICWTTWKKRR